MLKVVILTVRSELAHHEFDFLLSLVSPEKQERIRRFHFFCDKRNCLLGDILSRIEICRFTGLRNNQLQFTTNEYGKPLLINNPQIHFNISHTGHYIVCAVSDKPVGIDIELIKTIDMVIAERFFMPDETAFIMDGEQEKRFYEIWTRKESHIKWEGKGLHKPLNSFSVINPYGQESLYYHRVIQNENVVSYVCSTHTTAPSVEFLETSSLLMDIKL